MDRHSHTDLRIMPSCEGIPENPRLETCKTLVEVYTSIK